MTIYQEIADVLDVIPALHKDVFSIYLELRYNISTNIAISSLHKAALSHICFENENGFITRTPEYKITSRDRDLSRAFRVAIAFMAPGEENFCHSRILLGHSADVLMHVFVAPDELTLAKNPQAPNRLVQISCIQDGNEFVFTKALAENGVSKDMLCTLCRIGIVSPNFRVQNVKKVGYVMFVPFKSNEYDFNESDVISMDEATRWDDVRK